jgi:hypothetical protein
LRIHGSGGFFRRTGTRDADQPPRALRENEVLRGHAGLSGDSKEIPGKGWPLIASAIGDFAGPIVAFSLETGSSGKPET